MDIKVIVAAHKPYRMPQDSMYLPLHVGRALTNEDLGWQGDNTGNNISLKNSYYCELTGLYWAWKNLKADAIGLVHYRRFFKKKGLNLKYFTNKKWDNILSYDETEDLLYNYPIILPKKRHYYIETIESQYAHAHNIDHLYKVHNIIKKYHHDYLNAYEKHMLEKSGHMFNMFIMKYEYFNQYCSWLFDILFKLQKQIGDINRIYGYIAERLLDVWIYKNKINYFEKDIVYIEKQNLIKKYTNFILRKFKKNRKLYGFDCSSSI